MIPHAWFDDLTKQARAERSKSKFFIDAEFFEDGPSRPIELISLGIVSEAGDERYIVNRDFDWSRASEWLKANVEPQVMHLDPLLAPFSAIGPMVLSFINSVTDNDAEFWGYYCDYDWVVFCQIFGRMTDLPKGFPMYCLDIKQLAVSLGNPALPKQEGGEHHALADARWNKRAYEFLSGVKQSAGLRGAK